MKKTVFVLSAAALILAACNSVPGDVTEPKVDYSRYAVRVEPVITKVTETNFENGDAIGLSISRQAGVHASNEKLSYDGTSFTGSLKWYAEGADESTLSAYYPYAETVPTSFTVASDQTSGIASSDFVSAVKTGVLPSANAVSMVFKHRLSRLSISVTNNSGAAIDGITVKNVVPTADIAEDLTATVSATAQATDIKAYKGENNYYAIIPAQTVALTVAVEYAGLVREQKLAEATLVAGAQYSVSIIVNAADIKVVLSGEVENWTDGGELTGDAATSNVEEHLDENYIIYAGDRYSVKHLSNDLWIMTQNMRFVPEGKTVSSDPTDGNGIWYSYTSDGTTCTAETTDAAIEAHGLLYDHQVAFGSEITAENYKSFEGTQGICPDGWHIPTWAEFFSIVGKSNKTDDTDACSNENAVYYDKAYDGGRIKTMNEDGFNWDFAGAMNRTNTEATGAYQKIITKAATCSVEEWLGKNALTYYMGSTGYTPTGSAGVTKNRQFMSLMSTFTATYPEGKVNVAYTNFLGGYALRCIRDHE